MSAFSAPVAIRTYLYLGHRSNVAYSSQVYGCGALGAHESIGANSHHAIRVDHWLVADVPSRTYFGDESSSLRAEVSREAGVAIALIGGWLECTHWALNLFEGFRLGTIVARSATHRHFSVAPIADGTLLDFYIEGSCWRGSEIGAVC